MTTVTITTAADIAALLDDVAHALGDMPGAHPHDAQIARVLLGYTMSCLAGAPSQALLNTFCDVFGVDTGEAHAVARALQGAVLRLGAWLGRAR